MKYVSWCCAYSIVFVWCSWSRAEIQVLSSEEHPFEAGAKNQGYFKEAGTINSLSGNYFTGARHGVTPEDEAPSRGFFSFYIGDVNLPANAATLVLERGRETAINVENEPVETVEFFDVSTPAEYLNTTDTFTPEVFADLGTGSSYGTFDVPINTNGPSGILLRIPLNAAALADINSGPNAEYFSIGSALITNDGFDGVFGFTGTVAATLELTLVPEPKAGALLLSGIVVGFAGVGRTSRQMQRQLVGC